MRKITVILKDKQKMVLTSTNDVTLAWPSGVDSTPEDLAHFVSTRSLYGIVGQGRDVKDRDKAYKALQLQQQKS